MFLLQKFNCFLIDLRDCTIFFSDETMKIKDRLFKQQFVLLIIFVCLPNKIYYMLG